MRKTINGFTIVELLVVIVVIGILATITVVSYNGVHTRARATAAIAKLDIINKALEQYYALNESYPTTNENWNSQHNNANGFIPGLTPDIVSTLPVLYVGAGGGWNNDVLYRSNGTDYKLIVHNDNLCNAVQKISPTLADPQRKDQWNCWAYGYWSEGAQGSEW